MMPKEYLEAVDIFGNVVGTYHIETYYIDIFIQKEKVEKVIYINNIEPSNKMFHRNAQHIQELMKTRHLLTNINTLLIPI